MSGNTNCSVDQAFCIQSKRYTSFQNLKDSPVNAVDDNAEELYRDGSEELYRDGSEELYRDALRSNYESLAVRDSIEERTASW